MIGSSESHEEAPGIKRNVLSTKVKTKIVFSNVRTIFETGSLAQITAKMRKGKLHILGVSESRWTGTEKTETSINETILYSAREDAQQQERVLRILNKVTKKQMLEWKAVNSRLMKIRIRGKHVDMAILQG